MLTQLAQSFTTFLLIPPFISLFVVLCFLVDGAFPFVRRQDCTEMVKTGFLHVIAGQNSLQKSYCSPHSPFFYPQCWSAIVAAIKSEKEHQITVGSAPPFVLVMYKHSKLFGKLEKTSDGHVHMNVHMLNESVSICNA